jgi:hypothetical protein
MGAAMVAATVVLLTSTSLAAKGAGSSKSAPIRMSAKSRLLPQPPR